MKLHRQMYLSLFLAYCLFVALLFCPQLIVPHKIPDLFGTAAVGFIVSMIVTIIRSRKEGISLSRFIPALLIILVCLAQIVGLFLWGDPTASHERLLFWFYLMAALLNMAASAVGFFLK